MTAPGMETTQNEIRIAKQLFAYLSHWNHPGFTGPCRVLRRYSAVLLCSGLLQTKSKSTH
jgi:hypothetical protein